MLTIKNFPDSFQLLKKAQKLLKYLDSKERLHAITYNNLGCFYKSVQKYQLALQMFEKSLEFKFTDLSHQAGTYLNVSSIFSVLNNHQKALDYGCEALDLFKNIYTLDPSAINSLIFAAFTTGKEYETLNRFSQAENSYLYALELASTIPENIMTEKIHSSLISLNKKKQFNIKPRYASTLRNSELPVIRTNHSDIMKQYIIIEDKKKATPKVHKNYPPILDIPYGKTHSANVSSPLHKKGQNNLTQIKKELFEYEEKLKKISGIGKTIKIRSSKRQNLPKISLKNKIQFSENTPVSPPSLDLQKIAIVIQKNWRGFQARKSCRQERRKLAHQRAKEAIAELEILKQQAKIDELYTTEDIWRPRTYSPLKHQKSEKLYKTQGKFLPSSKYNEKYIIKLQAFVRMRIQYKKYNNIRSKVHMIQRNVKRYQCMKLFQKILSAILFLQYQWRKYLHKGYIQIHKRINN